MCTRVNHSRLLRGRVWLCPGNTRRWHWHMKPLAHRACLLPERAQSKTHSGSCCRRSASPEMCMNPPFGEQQGCYWLETHLNQHRHWRTSEACHRWLSTKRATGLRNKHTYPKRWADRVAGAQRRSGRYFLRWCSRCHWFVLLHKWFGCWAVTCWGVAHREEPCCCPAHTRSDCFPTRSGFAGPHSGKPTNSSLPEPLVKR